MATLFKGSLYPLLLSLVIFCGSHILLANCTEFEVGGHDGWAVPRLSGSYQMYNHWASQNRFNVGDTLRFKYEKDSVMVVTKEEYKRCRSSRPLFFSNNGDTVFKFDQPGMFYFISGVIGHCARGQKMIIKVLDVQAHAPQSENGNATEPHFKAGGAAEITPISITTSAIFVLSLFGLLYA